MDNDDLGYLIFASIGILAFLAFWGVVGYIVLHFVDKFW